MFYAFGGIVVALAITEHRVNDGRPTFTTEQNVKSAVKYLTIATFIFSVTFTCTAIATNFIQQAAIRMVMGFAQSIITPLSVDIISNLFSKENGTDSAVKASAFGVFNYGVYAAFSLSLSLGKYICELADLLLVL